MIDESTIVEEIRGKGGSLVEQQPQKQIYDATLKALFGQEVADILPILVPGAEFISERNVEIDRTIIKADLIFWGRLNGQIHLINMELQSSEDDTIVERLLMYHACFHFKHKVPVLSVILYPFETKLPEPPYREQGGNGTLLTFEYQVIALRKKDARVYVQMHAVCLYTLLPAMQHATVQLLKQALREMRQYYPDNKQFSSHLTRFYTIMLRSTIMTEEQKQEMKEVLKMIYEYDMFIDENPDVQERVQRSRTQALAEGKALGLAEGKALGLAEGEVLSLQKLAITAIKTRFPALLANAQPQIEQIQDTNALGVLILQLASVTDEGEVCKLLHIRKARSKRKQ